MRKRNDPHKEVHFPRPGPRGPTDVPCALAFLATLLLMAGTVYYSWKHGETRRLTHGFDFKGKLCGVDPEVADKRYLYYCGTQGPWDGDMPRKLNFNSRTCVAECPANNAHSIACLMHAFHNFTEMPGGVVQNNLTFVTTLSLEITQSVTYQRSYPTSVFRGKYCVPQWRANNTLMEDVIHGPLKRQSRVSTAAGSFRHAWPVVLGAAVLAVALGITYLYVLRNYAGPLIFVSLCVGTVLLLIVGFFFILGVFFNPWYSEGVYQRMNPIYRNNYGNEARAYSVVLGILLGGAGAFLGLTTYNSAMKIDESIGIIHAACDCLFSPGPGRLDLLSQPLVAGLLQMLVLFFCFLGFMLACSVGYIDDTGIIINDERMHSLQKSFRFHWWWKPVMLFYFVGAIWLLEYLIACGHFAVSYAVCLWYFTEIELIEGANNSKHYKDAQSGHLQRVNQVRVQGVGNIDAGERAGYLENGPGGKVLIVPVGRRGPTGRDFTEADEKTDLKRQHCGAVLKGFNAGIFYHTGSLAMGAIIVTLTRPFRWVSHSIKGLVGPGEDQNQDPEERNVGTMAIAGLSLLSMLLDSFFGGYSKNAYVEMVLSSNNFFKSAQDSLEFLSEAGGAVAFLHGSTAMYEMIAVFVITLICGNLSLIVLTQVPYFNEQTSPMYVSDPWMMTVLASFVSCMIAFSFMSLFNVTADALLYVFAWSRRHHLKDIETFCPHALKKLVGRELDDAPEPVQLQARAKAKRNRFQQAAQRYAGTIMSSMRPTGAEQRPLLPNSSYR